MRELTKSVMSFSWAMSLYGFDRTMDLMACRGAKSFDAVTQAARGQLGRLTEPSFRTGDALQRQMVDLMFGMMPGNGGGGATAAAGSAATAGGTGGSPSGVASATHAAMGVASSTAAGAAGLTNQLLGLGIEMLQQGMNVITRLTGQGGQQGQSGWGPVPPPPAA